MVQEEEKNEEKKNEEVTEKYIGRTNVADYGVPSGVQLTENLNEEIAEGAQRKTPERPAEK